jgi:hypothetical protein
MPVGQNVFGEMTWRRKKVLLKLFLREVEGESEFLCFRIVRFCLVLVTAVLCSSSGLSLGVNILVIALNFCDELFPLTGCVKTKNVSEFPRPPAHQTLHLIPLY